MKIEIWVDGVEPPTGSAVRAGGAPVGEPGRFVGWLGLLRVLSELFGLEEELAEPLERVRGELGPR